MLVIHASYAENQFFLWGERSFEFEELLSYDRLPDDKVKRLPWDAGGNSVHEALKLAGIRHTRKSAAESIVTAYIKVPLCEGIPIPSSPLLGERPSFTGEPSTGIVRIEVIPVSLDEMQLISQILSETTEKLFVPGMLWGSDVKFIVKALEYAALMVMRGTYLPDMEQVGEGYFSAWKPLHLARYQDEYSLYIQALPPVLRGFSLSEDNVGFIGREALAASILEILLDYIVRKAQSVAGKRGRQVDQNNPHEIWLRSLTWPKAALSRWNEEMKLLYPQIRSWADSVKAVTSQPWKMFLRLEEPVAGDAENIWTLSWHLQSARDQSLVIPASRVWSPEPAERRWFRIVGVNPRRYMLQVLGQIASLVPAIARSLDESCPVECTLSLDELFVFMHDHVPNILDQGIQIQFPASWGSTSDRPRLAVRGNVKNDSSFSNANQINLGELLDFNWTVSLGEETLSNEELQMLMKLKTPLANIRGRWVLLYRDELENIMEAINKLPKKMTRREALLSSFSESKGDIPISGITGSRWLDSIKCVLTGTEQIEELSQPEGFVGNLRPYQKKGLSWLAWLTKLGLGGCLADDMGLGKTIQALALLKTLHIEGESRPVLLICPTSVIENWRREALRFVPDMAVMIHHGTKRLKEDKFTAAANKMTLVISSYSLLHRDNAIFQKIGWAGIILDEAQNIKNPDTRQARAARSVSADWHLALTGTPVENHVGDIWSIMEFLLPGLLPNRTKFGHDFLRPIQSGELWAMEKIKRVTGPFILRRLKTDKKIISDLPEKIETEVFCSLSREQASLYGAVLSTLDKSIAGADGIKRKGIVLAAITSLKQICNHPALYLKDHSQLDGRSGKIARLTEIAEEMLSVGDRALIFTQYAEMGAMLKKYLQETFGREVLFLHGGIEREKRDEMVRKFQDSDNPAPFFVLSLKAGGTGLNLTGANHVVMFDRWWNPAVEQQAVDRAYRIGQKQNVQVHYFCCKGTLEEKIEALIESKKRVADAVVGSGESWLTEFSDDELREFFALSRDAVEDIN